MTNWKDQQVLIVGGGIGGLAAALALARKGIASQVIEQAPEFKEIGAGIQLGPNVFWMFEVLGLIEPISALAVFPNNLIMMDSVTGAGGHPHSARRQRSARNSITPMRSSIAPICTRCCSKPAGNPI